ncbi:hypothetical protein PACTADRAFT_48290 [Pachysolen tannophilus NRRL Y-2460]|uniref:Uncharacterized protein n=1 Tax=Pachysolen tannophilus NRRL Y-2460 TaxID=669874 RepID=A0A1E4U3I5_PACTA|nr:hypothetical protein PACTADRAFT_48290 [Pachysolen tannophilus NRRL Y-2460]
MRIIKRFIQALKYESFGKDILPVVHNSLLILIKANPTAEIMRSLSLYIVYALNEKNAETEDNKEESLQKCCGICALDVLVSFICDPSLISSSLTSSSNHHNESSMTAVFYKKLSKSITVRWILLLLDDSNPKVVKLSLRLLIRMLAILGLKFYNNFIAHNGLDILATTLNKWWFDNEIVVLLYSGVFGISQSQDLGSDLVQFAKRLSKRGNKLQIAMPSFLYLINSLIIYGIEELDSYGKNQLNKNGNNEKFDDITLNLTSLLNSYIIASETSYENIISLKNFFRSDIKWLSDNLTILNKLDCLSYNVKTIEIINAYHNFIRILSHNFIELLFNNDAGNGKFPGNEGSVDFVKVIDNMQNQESSLVLHRLIYPKILEHMQNFKDVLPDLIINGDKSPVFLVCSLKFFESCYESLNSHKWNTDELLRFIEVISNVAEFSELKRINEKYVSKFKDILGDVYLKCFIESIHLSDFETVKKLLINHLLFHQTIYFGNDVLDNKKISTLITLLIKNCELEIEDVEISSLSINALRMLLLYRQNDIEKIVELISAKLDNKFTITANFFNALLVSSDEEVENKIFNDSNVSNVFSENFKIIIEENSTYLQLPKLDDKLVQISNNGFTANEDFINNFEKDNRNWKKSIVSSELSKYYRHIQDHQDNVQFYISIYNNMRIESTRVLYGENTLSFQWYVDSIEGANRMRKRLIPEFDKNDSSVLLLADSNSAKLNESNNENGNNNEEGDSNNREILTSTLSDLSSSSSKNAELTEGFELIDIDQSSTAEEIDLIQEDKNRKVLRSLYIGDKIIDLWNTSQILGLEAIESILIMGNTHLYLIKNYFHCSNNGEIVDIDDAPAEERDPYMQLIIGPKKKNNNNLATNGNNTNGSSQETKLKKDHQTKSWELEKLTSVSKRQFLFRDVALEFFFVDGSSFLITCKTTKERDTIYSKVSHLATGKGIDKDLSQAFKFAAASFSAHNNNNGNGASTSNKFFNKLSNAFNSNSINFSQITKKWQRGEMSNFYYLMIINTLAGRTFNDLTQYPVFPWVIADYSSEELDLSDPNIYRDLTRPMGGQGENRENTFKERYEALASLEDPDAPPFHYGTHYSSAMIVTSYLIRLEPYVQSYLLLQGGKFDHADRLFYSIAKAWNSASKENTTDVRELIPEFFYLPEFLTNENNYNFGKLQDGTPVKDVELPPWAKNDPTIFIQKNREALESPYASSHLHEWIDLIFGYKQRGQSAVEATNVFHHLSYNGAIDLDKIDDEIERRAMTGIIHNFGQTPLQIFTKAHPARDELQSPKLDIKKMLDIPISISESNLKLPIKNIELKDDHWKGHSSLYCNAEKILIRGTGIIGSLSVNGVVFEQLHNSKINALVPYGNRMFLTGSSDGTIHSWKYIIKSSFNSSSSVTIGRKDSFGDSKDGRNSNNSLNFLGVLRAHNSSVIDIKVAPAFNSALSLDERGNVWLLDLVRLNVVRKIKTNNKEKVQNIAIANDTGNIVAASATWIEVFTINGTLIISQNLYEYDPATSNIENKISAIDFAQPNWSFINSSPHHEYWEKSSIIVVGGINKVEVLELKVFAGKWNLTNFRTFNLTSENASGTTIITTVKMKLTTELDGDGTKVGSAEIVCGDNRGRVINWH